jgi:hypothetical protein
MFYGHCHSEKGERRGPRFIFRVLGGLALAMVFALVFSIFVRMLWNWLMPSLFNFGTITYGQAFGLMVLARLIFGSMGHHRGHPGPGRGKHGFHRPAWLGCGCATDEGSNHEIEDWRHYDAWWDAEGREAYKKYAAIRKDGKEGDAS